MPFEPAHRIVGQPLALFAHEVPGAMFVELEAWCLAHGLPLVRRSRGYPRGWSPERVVFTGAGAVQSYETNDDDRILISCETVLELRSYEAVLDHLRVPRSVCLP